MLSPKKNRFLLLFGSQTGQAEAIAEEIHDQAGDFALEADLHCLSGVDKKFSIESEKVAVFIVSTTGEGEPPEKTHKFWKRLSKTTHSATYLSHLQYCLLGLGDSNYNNFANFGKLLDRRLQQLGARRFSASAFADDAVGLEVAAEPWIEKLWPALKCVLYELKPPDCHSIQIDIMDEAKSARIKQAEHSTIDKTEESVLGNSNDQLDSGVRSSDNFNKNSSLTDTESRLKNMKLNLPPLPQKFLEVKFNNDDLFLNSHSDHPVHNNCKFPSSVSKVHCVPVVSAVKLTSSSAVKSVLELTIDISDTDLEFEPGDSFGIVCENEEEEVEEIIQRLELGAVADLLVQIELFSGDKKQKAQIPEYWPSSKSLRYILLACNDIRAVPKKAFLRMLAEYTTNVGEQRRLQELCSRQGSEEYIQFIRQQNLSLLDILMAFPSCKPPIDRILEHLPRLQARPFSVASSSLKTPDTVRCVFSIVEISKDHGRFRDRKGVCTGWLNKLTKHIQVSLSSFSKRDLPSLDESLSRVTLSDIPKICIFKRVSTGFHLPGDLSVPTIMIGAGTGIAPFIGFLEHRLRRDACNQENWLIFGCRHKERDFIYREQIQQYQQQGVLKKVSVVFSRDSSTDVRYVQHLIRQHADDFIEWITNKQATIYVCGDAKNMANDVRIEIQNALMQVKSMSVEDSQRFIFGMQKEKKYLQDIWT